ncbi:helix-turn-helix domain-containing protein [Brachybacterium tyrofermentans]|uniref:helix-turn-helix domain-containing protein n=1 Tax=Brachybacterium tyrofermentans TaxID=47848 RepID=UPI00186836FA|nr:helix-turn-helix transcriptional regulator [Brachybacterium tyrofermentans]
MTSFTIDADRLTSYRDAEGIASNADLARRMGVDPATVSRVLAGRNGPSTRFVAGLQKAFPGRDVMGLVIIAA